MTSEPGGMGYLPRQGTTANSARHSLQVTRGESKGQDRTVGLFNVLCESQSRQQHGSPKLTRTKNQDGGGARKAKVLPWNPLWEMQMGLWESRFQVRLPRQTPMPDWWVPSLPRCPTMPCVALEGCSSSYSPFQVCATSGQVCLGKRVYIYSPLVWKSFCS